jgi:membrane protease YdiL (CAAX protease family)
LHTQYSWFFLAQTFRVGLIFGYWRYPAGSTWLAVITHGAWNAAVMAQIALMVTDTWPLCAEHLGAVAQSIHLARGITEGITPQARS